MVTMSRSEIKRRAITDPLKLAERYYKLQDERDIFKKALEKIAESSDTSAHHCACIASVALTQALLKDDGGSGG